MTGTRSKLLVLLGASLLLGGLRLAHADGTSLPIVDLGSGTTGKCFLGLIDDPEPWPTAFRGLQSVSMHWVLGTHGEMYLTGPASLQCGGASSVPLVIWETSSPLGKSVVLRFAHDGTWSEPAVFTDREMGSLEEPAASLGTLRLSRGSLRKEGSTMPSTRLRRPIATPPTRALRTASEDGPPSVLVSPVTGATIVVWSRHSATGFDLLASEFVSGAWGEPRKVAGSAPDERDPQLVAGADGAAYLLTWVDGPAPRVLLRQASGDLRTWSAPSVVSGPGELASRPAGAFHEGILHVVYERHDLGVDRAPTSVVLARRDGDAWISEVLAVSWNGSPLRPASHSEQGRLWVNWDDGAGANGWVRMDADGRWEPPRYEPAGGSEARDPVRLRALSLP